MKLAAALIAVLGFSVVAIATPTSPLLARKSKTRCDHDIIDDPIDDQTFAEVVQLGCYGDKAFGKLDCWEAGYPEPAQVKNDLKRGRIPGCMGWCEGVECPEMKQPHWKRLAVNVIEPRKAKKPKTKDRCKSDLLNAPIGDEMFAKMVRLGCINDKAWARQCWQKEMPYGSQVGDDLERGRIPGCMGWCEGVECPDMKQPEWER